MWLISINGVAATISAIAIICVCEKHQLMTNVASIISSVKAVAIISVMMASMKTSMANDVMTINNNNGSCHQLWPIMCNGMCEPAAYHGS